MRFDGIVGPPSAALGEGVEAQLRLSKYGYAGVAQASARYAEAVSRGRCYRGQTAVAGVAPGTSIGTTGAFSLYNPANSGVNLVLLEVSMGYISGTLGAGTIFFVANTNINAAATTGTAITAVNALVGSGYTAVGSALTTSTLPATPTVMGPFCSLGASLASTAVQPWQIVRDVGGGIVVAPGATVSLEGVTAAGSSPLVAFGALWEEVAV